MRGMGEVCIREDKRYQDRIGEMGDTKSAAHKCTGPPLFQARVQGQDSVGAAERCTLSCKHRGQASVFTSNSCKQCAQVQYQKWRNSIAIGFHKLLHLIIVGRGWGTNY